MKKKLALLVLLFTLAYPSVSPGKIYIYIWWTPIGAPIPLPVIV